MAFSGSSCNCFFPETKDILTLPILSPIVYILDGRVSQANRLFWELFVVAVFFSFGNALDKPRFEKLLYGSVLCSDQYVHYGSGHACPVGVSMHMYIRICISVNTSVHTYVIFMCVSVPYQLNGITCFVILFPCLCCW